MVGRKEEQRLLRSLAFEKFWYGFAFAQKNIMLIACGSAASWITKKIFRNTGGLHNR